MITDYHVIKALHLISMVAWMAAMLYLPRLYVYHAGVAVGSEASELLKVMERRLLRYICNPAMIATFVFGLWLGGIVGFSGNGWLHAKLGLVLILAGCHGMLAKWRKDFAADRNTHPAKFYRIANEVPTVLMILIIFLAVLKPF
jgi:putative membrane protein